jgi:UDP-N-acetyl-D-mannosaminuronic acid transferase (WecB/TagA/CpsF family)
MGIRDDDGVWSVRLERTPSARTAVWSSARGALLLRWLGLEWLYRLLRQPWRLRRRMAIPLFVRLVAKERLRTETA